MSYSLRYGVSRFDKHLFFKKKKKYLFIFVFVLSLIALHILFPDQSAQVRRHVLPFLEPNVQDAFASMTESIEAGNSLGDAATVFCREIIREAVH